MLKKFSVNNFKNFDSELTFDLTSGRFDFNNECVKNKIDNISVIYGYNACGKSNLMLAIFDIIETITDKNTSVDEYLSYQNVRRQTEPVSFKYDFEFNNQSVRYEYKKMNFTTILTEHLFINEKLVISREAGEIQLCTLAGAESLEKRLANSNLSAVKYVSKNANLQDCTENVLFKEFIKFVDNMLLFWCLQGRKYIGYENDTSMLLPSIYKAGLMDEYNNFLNNLGIKRTIIEKDTPAGDMAFYYDYGQRKLLRYDDKTQSNGEKALLLFFYWISKSKRKDSICPSVIAIDEFDAFYHITLSKKLINLLKEMNCQVILTSHNSYLISNEILRPDCYFYLQDGQINNFANLIDKDIRQAQNLERMFRAGEFINNG